MLSIVVTHVEFAWSPKDIKLFLLLAIFEPVEAHIHSLCALGLHAFFIRPAAVALSVCSFVGCCLWPSVSSVCRIVTASRVLMYNAAISASVADAITFLIIWETAWTAPLRW